MPDRPAAAIDTATLDELERSVGDDRAFLRELVDAFMDDAPRQLEAMRRGLAEADAQLLRRSAHTLKSNAASLGALRLSELCRELEFAARASLDNGLEPADAALAERIKSIGAQLERAMSELNALVPGDGS